MKSYISIHDVAPHNLNDIKNIICTLENEFGINKICLLVIPGLNWNKQQIQSLQKWQNDGIEIAAHGWIHQAEKNKSFYHRIHSLVMSADSAEHLSKKRQDVYNMMKKSYSWFINNGFQKPLLYVPPAWALGKITKKDLNRMAFTYYECTTGMIHNQKYYFLPLLGFEERTLIKASFRRFFNKFNYWIACFTGLIRIAIHPNDFRLYMKEDITKYLSRSDEAIFLHELT